MTYDTQVIYGSTKVTKDSFYWNGDHYYTTKTGRLKKKEQNSKKSEMVIKAEYEYFWNKYQEVFR